MHPCPPADIIRREHVHLPAAKVLRGQGPAPSFYPAELRVPDSRNAGGQEGGRYRLEARS